MSIKAGAKLSYKGARKAQETDKIASVQYSAFRDTGPYRPIFYNNNVLNEQQALYQRVLKQTPVVDATVMKDFVSFVKHNFHKLIPVRRIRSDDINTYLRNSNAQPSVKKSILKAYEQLYCEGVNYNSSLNHRMLHKYTTRKAFVKEENLSYQGKCGILRKAPRLIQGAQPQFIALVGPWFSRLQRHFKQHWNRSSVIFYVCGSSALEMGNYVSTGGNILEDDVSAWDSSLGVDLCKLEVWIAQQFRAPKAVVDLMTANISTHGYTSNGWKYQVPGTRKSGDPYTSLFNSVINGLLHVFVYCQQTNTSVSEVMKSHQLKMLVNGDDNLLLHGGNPISWRLMLQLGFKSISKYRQHLRESEFCSSVPIRCVEGTCFVPKVGKLISKFGYFVRPPLRVKPKSLLRGVCLGFQHLFELPVFQQFFDPIMLMTRHEKAVVIKWEEHKYKLSKITPNELTEYDILSRYDFPKHFIDELKKEFMKVNKSYDNVVTELLFDRDTDGIKFTYRNE